MTDLAEADEDCYIPLKTLSHRRNLSMKYLEQILIQLGKSGLVTGSRGTTENNHLESEGNDFFWKEFTININNFVDSITLDELAQKNKAFIGYDYCI